VPLLAESPLAARVDRVLVVDCEEDTQVPPRDAALGLDRSRGASVIAQQAPREARRAIADAVIHNDGITLEQLAQQVRRSGRCGSGLKGRPASAGLRGPLWNNRRAPTPAAPQR
jgi:dephospho-CoA kinase